MLGVGHVHVADDVHDAAVRLLRQALVLAAVAGLHVEDGDVQALGADDAQAAVGVAQNQHAVGTGLREELVGTVDDVAACRAQVVAHDIHIYFRLRQLEVAEEDAVEVVVVVLAGVREDHVKVLAALVDDGGQADDFRACAHDDAKLQPAVLLPLYVGIVCLHLVIGLRGHNRCPASPGRTVRCSTSRSPGRPCRSG